jgi:hypothetical protein
VRSQNGDGHGDRIAPERPRSRSAPVVALPPSRQARTAKRTRAHPRWS